GLGYQMAFPAGTYGIDVQATIVGSAGASPTTLPPDGVAANANDCTVASAANTLVIADGSTKTCEYDLSTLGTIIAKQRVKGNIVMTWSDGTNSRSRSGNLAVTVET
ncbi:MAG: hypothetical protein AABX72_03070, partial [Nanoarchaeota archaeon]